MATQGQDPEITYTDPLAYIAWLRTQRVPPVQIQQMVSQRFGPGKTPQQRAQEASKQQSRGGLAATAGTVGGLVAANEVYRGFPNIKDVFGIGGETGSEGLSQSGTLSISRPVPAPTTTVSGAGDVVDLGGNAPQVISSQGATSTVQTPVGNQQVPTESLNDPGFWSNVNWGQVAQGGLSLAQMYGAYQSYKSGDKAGAAIQGLAGAGNLASATGAVASGAAAGTTGAYVIPGLNILAGGYSGYKTAEALGDMAAGAKRTRTGVVGGATSGAAIGAGVGTMILPGAGTAIGAGIGATVGAITGAIGSLTGSKKNKGQMQRDAIRGALQERGLLDEKWQGTLANGTKADFGQDGSKLNTKAMNQLRIDNPNAFESTQQLGDALAASYGFVGDKARSIARLYVRGALSNANDDSNVAVSNMQHFAKQQGINLDLIKGNLDQALSQNRITQGEYNRVFDAARQLTGGQTQQQVARPKRGELARVSPGMYMDSSGRVGRQQDMRKALQRNMEKKGK